MSERMATRVGRVRHVLGSTVTVELDEELAGVAPIFRGKLQPIGQIGSLVRIPQGGVVDLVAQVSLVGIAELSGAVEPTEMVEQGKRWLQIELLGEIDRVNERFVRGVSAYPSLDDEVHFATPTELATIFPEPSEDHLEIGKLASAGDIPVCLEAKKLVVRHSAVVGSTGSGKTSAVASMLQGFITGGWGAANIVVVDPHGEYANAFSSKASVRSVSDTGSGALRVPFWALPSDTLCKVFTGLGPASFAKAFAEEVKERRKEFAKSVGWIKLKDEEITPDTPIPFSMNDVWYWLDYRNRGTVQKKGEESWAVEEEGDPFRWTQAKFETHQQGTKAPYQGPQYGHYGNGPDLLRIGFNRPELAFLANSRVDANKTDPLEEIVQSWLGEDKAVSVLDFSGVPREAADVAIGVVLNLIFELALRSERDGHGIGRPSPVLVVLEEAHRYLGDEANVLAKGAANRIAREGRKYGVGLMMVTQRPTELPKTALAQCGTIMSLRLSNSEDQGAVRTALPDAISGLASALPALRTHEALVSGEAVVIPCRVRVRNPNPWPKAEDPDLSAWRQPPKNIVLKEPIERWRRGS